MAPLECFSAKFALGADGLGSNERRRLNGGKFTLSG